MAHGIIPHRLQIHRQIIAMKIIPVIDLMDGEVVHARMGDRQHYQAIQSPLCATSHALDMVQALATLYRFDSLYIADLDALRGKAPQLEIIRQIHQQFAQLHILLDAGLRHMQQIHALPAAITPVIGSENFNQLADFVALAEQLQIAQRDWLLSLDFKNAALLGCAEILQQSQHWPRRVILMSLSHVGAESGPNWSLLRHYQALHSEREWLAAGGVGSDQDLQQLAQMGITQALLATALHQGKISSAYHVSQTATQSAS